MKHYYEAYEDRYQTIHALGHAWSSDRPTPIVGEILARYGVPKTASLLELGCGEGRDALPLLRTGWNLLATDLSPEAVAWCRKLAPDRADRFRVLDCLGGELPTRSHIPDYPNIELPENTPAPNCPGGDIPENAPAPNGPGGELPENAKAPDCPGGELPENAQAPDCPGSALPERFDFIYAVAVLHMLTEDADRARFFAFIRDHLTKEGLALVCAMGDGERELRSDPARAFDPAERDHPAGPITVAATTCRIVSFDTLTREIQTAGLSILETGLTPSPPDFDRLMYAVVSPFRP